MADGKASQATSDPNDQLMRTVGGPDERSPSFEDALADALEQCARGETPDSAAAALPDYDLLPYLELAERLRVSSPARSSPQWLRRSLMRVLRRVSR